MAEGKSSKTFDKLLKKVTSQASPEPNWQIINQICDLIKKKPSIMKYAVTEIRKKLGDPNPNVALIARQVLYSVLGNCGTLVFGGSLGGNLIAELENTTFAPTAPPPEEPQLQLPENHLTEVENGNKTEAELEEELQLALAISQSEAEMAAKRELEQNPQSSKILRLPNGVQSESKSSKLTSQSSREDFTTAPKGCDSCFERSIDSVIYPCGHMSMCFQCSITYWKTNGHQTCPICGTSIQDIIRIYNP